LEDFAAYLMAARKTAGITQTELASAAGLTASYLSFIENRKKPPPSDDVCRRLAKVLDLPADELLERAHLQRAPKELRAKVQSLTSSLHSERKSLRHFLQDLLTPFLFSGPPGYADSAMEVLALSAQRRRRIREAARRGASEREGREREMRHLVDELSDDELRDLVARVPRLFEGQAPKETPVLYAPPERDDPRSGESFLMDLEERQLGTLDSPTPGDRVLVDPTATPAGGDYLLLRAEPAGVVRQLVQEGGGYRFVGAVEGPSELMPPAELFHRLEMVLAGVLVEVRRPLRRRD
jgi:transcriptional regulator with XRE-family HTH domain